MVQTKPYALKGDSIIEGWCGCAGEWVDGQRQGYGICKFADKSKFKGEWEGDAWVQGLAHPGHTKVKGLGLSRAVAGVPATFTILVSSIAPLFCCSCSLQCKLLCDELTCALC